MTKTNNSRQAGRAPVTFAAIDSYVERNIIAPTERTYSGQERVQWGPGDKYPAYILDLYERTATLNSVIRGCVDFIAGDEVRFRGDAAAKLNKLGQTPQQVVRAIAMSIERLGGLAINVIRALDGKPVEVYPYDVSTIRSNKDNTAFWYSEKWGRSTNQPVEMAAFMPGILAEWSKLDEEARKKAASTLLFRKLTDDMRTYPTPSFASAVKACETESCIDDYHLNSIDNAFAGSALVNFNNGVADDEIQEEVERNFNEKFSGHANGGRIVFSWNPNRDSQTQIIPIKTEDFGEKYAALAKHCRQQIYTAFRANPNLFGIPTESLGFSSEEYESAFKLFNRTHVRPIQRMIADAFEYIYGEPGILEIVPFTLDGNGESAVR